MSEFDPADEADNPLPFAPMPQARRQAASWSAEIEGAFAGAAA